MTSQASSSVSASTEKIEWTPPANITSVSVLLDRYTTPPELQNLVGKETEPSRMGIYICLLDDRPHLHPNLAALHKHRLVIHSIPLPADPSVDPPVPTIKDGEEWLTWRYSEEEEVRRKAYLPLT